MKSPPRNMKEDSPRVHEDRSTQTIAEDDSWLVRFLVFSLRAFFVLFVAFARAVVIVAGDTIPETLFEQVIPAAVSPSSPQVDSNLGSLEATQPTATSAPPQSYYVVFIGREVGYTTSGTLMTSLVNGVPNNFSQKFNTFNEAIHAYMEAVQLGNVRRVRTVIQPSGHLEFMYEYMSISAGILNLDMPHMTPQPLIPATLPSDQPPSTPCNSETCVDQRNRSTGVGVSVSHVNEPNVVVLPPDHWSMINAREASADTVIISTASLSTPANETSHAPGSLTVIVLDSDDDSTNSSILANNSVTSTHSAHSSDVYYTDKRYDIAFAAYIEEEDSNAVGVEANSAAGPAQTE